MNKVRASVIGSLPRLADNLTSSIAYAVDLQLKHDIEVISDGEQRSDMIEYSTDLPGIASHNGRAYIHDKITVPQNPEKTFKILDLTIAQNYLKKIGSVGILVTTLSGCASPLEQLVALRDRECRTFNEYEYQIVVVGGEESKEYIEIAKQYQKNCIALSNLIVERVKHTNKASNQ